MKTVKVGDHISGKYLDRIKVSGTIVNTRTDWNMIEIFIVKLDKQIKNLDTHIELYLEESKL